MAIIERLLNLDVDMKILGTKAYLAKNDVVEAVKDFKRKPFKEEKDDQKYKDEVQSSGKAVKRVESKSSGSGKAVKCVESKSSGSGKAVKRIEKNLPID